MSSRKRAHFVALAKIKQLKEELAQQAINATLPTKPTLPTLTLSSNELNYELSEDTNKRLC